MRDVFGNYVIQKMLEHANQAQINLMFGVIQKQVAVLAFDQYGCRVIQKAIEVITPQMQKALIQPLLAIGPRIMFDSNGNHVIQRCIQKMEKGDISSLVQWCKGRVAELSRDVNGCRII
jgi:hypothetical protein